MLFYVLLCFSCYVILKDVKITADKRKILIVYAAILGIGLMYNMGEFIGKQLYLLGFTI